MEKKFVIRNIYGGTTPIYKAIGDANLARQLIANWNYYSSEDQTAIRNILGSYVSIVETATGRLFRSNPDKNYISPQRESIILLFHAGILKSSSPYEQINKILYKGVNLEYVERILSTLRSNTDICQAFECLADRWIIHETKNGSLYANNSRIDSGLLEIINKFVEENKPYITGLFHYDFDLRKILGHEDETNGESVMELRESIVRGTNVDFGGDTLASVFEENDAYMESESFYQQIQIDNRGYHNPDMLPVLLARMFQPAIILLSMNKILKTNISFAEAEEYLSYRKNDVLLENLQNAMELHDEFHSRFDFSKNTSQEAIKQIYGFMNTNQNLLTEEGIAVLKYMKAYILPMLSCNGSDIYSRTIKNGIETVVTYDMYFDAQLNRFSSYMAEPRAIPSVCKAFLVDGMYGSGKRRVTSIVEYRDYDADLCREFDASFIDSYERYNKDGNLDALLKEEQKRHREDQKLVVMSLDAIRDAGGDDADWDRFVSDGEIDPVFEAILEMEGLNQF